jgi:hypothetical protein
MNRLSIVLSILLLSCSANISSSRIKAKHPTNTKEFSTKVYTDSECVKLSDSSDNWLFASKFLGIGGVASVSTIWIDNKIAKGVVGSTLATSAAFGVAALWMGEQKAKKFKEYCKVLDKEEVVQEVTALEPNELEESPYVDGGVK